MPTQHGRTPWLRVATVARVNAKRRSWWDAARLRIVQAAPTHKEFSAVRQKLCDVGGRTG